MTEQNLNTEQSNSTKTVLCNGLRVGNYLKYKNTNDLAIVELIHKKHFDCRDEFGLFTPNGNYEPITLNEEWFLKCKSNSIFNNGFEYKKTTTGRFEVYVGISLITVIEFVHELQNLNFALLGEDIVFENV